MKELSVKELGKIQKRASKKAVRINKALGLTYLLVRNDKLIEIDSNGQEKIIGSPEFKTVKVKNRKISLK